ncbi:MAG: hypothetical protein ACP5IT_07625 [Thermoproteota archaeon]
MISENSLNSVVPFYCSPFEKQMILYFTAKFLKKYLDLYDKKLNFLEDVDDIIDDTLDEATRDLFSREMPSPILNEGLFPPSKKSNEEIKNEEEQLSDLVLYKYKGMEKALLDNVGGVNFSLTLQLEHDKQINEDLCTFTEYLKCLLLCKEMSLTITLALLDNSSDPKTMSFFDSIISCLTTKYLKKILQAEVNLNYKYWYDYCYDMDLILAINFLSLFLSEKGLVELLMELVEQLKYKEFQEAIITEKDLRFPSCYILNNEYFKSFSEELCRVDYSRLNTFGFGFVKELKVCKICSRGYIKNVEKCDCSSSDFKPYTNKFLVSKKCYDILKDGEKFGIYFERYAYLSIRKLFATKQLNFIVLRNITINQEELDIVCIPLGDLFKKILVIECKITCEDRDVSTFKSKINNIFEKGMNKIYPAIVCLKSKVCSKNEGVRLCFVYEIKKLIEDYVRNSLQS